MSRRTADLDEMKQDTNIYQQIIYTYWIRTRWQTQTLRMPRSSLLRRSEYVRPPMAVNMHSVLTTWPVRTAEEGASKEGSAIQPVDPDTEFGGPEERKKLERKLVWKIDCRMSILVLIYLLNYVRATLLEEMI